MATPNAPITAQLVPLELDVGEIAASHDWREIFDVYVQGKFEGRETHTVRAYRRHVGNFFAWAGIAVDRVTPAVLATYRAELADQGKAPATRAQAISAVRSFLGWCRAVGGARHLPDAETMRHVFAVPSAKVERPYQVLTDAEISALGRVAVEPRDRAILALLLGAGVRVSEVVALGVADVLEDDDGAVAHLRQAKGSKDRTVPLAGDVVDAIRSYLAVTGRVLGGGGRLFLPMDRAARARGKASLSTQAVGLLVRRLLERAGVRGKAISPHSLRHTFAIRYLRAGGDIVALRKLLGHASIKTTQRYVDHLGVRELAATLPALPWGTAA